MSDTTKTAEERAREIVESLCDLPPANPDALVHLDVGTVAKPIADALNQEHQRGYERGLEAEKERVQKLAYRIAGKENDEQAMALRCFAKALDADNNILKPTT